VDHWRYHVEANLINDGRKSYKGFLAYFSFFGVTLYFSTDIFPYPGQTPCLEDLHGRAFNLAKVDHVLSMIRPLVSNRAFGVKWFDLDSTIVRFSTLRFFIKVGPEVRKFLVLTATYVCNKFQYAFGSKRWCFYSECGFHTH